MGVTRVHQVREAISRKPVLPSQRLPGRLSTPLQSRAESEGASVAVFRASSRFNGLQDLCIPDTPTAADARTIT